MASIFDHPVAFEALVFRNGATYRKAFLIFVISMNVLYLSKFGVDQFIQLRKRGARTLPIIRLVAIIYSIINYSAADGRILLKFGDSVRCDTRRPRIVKIDLQSNSTCRRSRKF